MATTESTVVVVPPTIRRLTVPEVQALCDRLYSRSLSPLFAASPQVRLDLAIASKTIRALLSQVDRLASECEDKAYLLRNIQVDVGDC
jgi:hypothetical protein